MAFILSTKDGFQITGNQARAFHQNASQYQDMVFRNFGKMLEVKYSGLQLTVDTGGGLVGGTIFENNSPVTLDLITSGTSGTKSIVIEIDLATSTVSAKIVPSIYKQDLVQFPAGRRQMEIYRVMHTATSITALLDVRNIPAVEKSVTGTIQNFTTVTIPVPAGAGKYGQSIRVSLVGKGTYGNSLQIRTVYASGSKNAMKSSIYQEGNGGSGSGPVPQVLGYQDAASIDWNIGGGTGNYPTTATVNIINGLSGTSIRSVRNSNGSLGLETASYYYTDIINQTDVLTSLILKLRNTGTITELSYTVYFDM